MVSTKKPSGRIKDFYYLIQNFNWGNYLNSKNYKYLLFTDLNEQIIYDNKYVDKTSQNLIELIQEDLLVIINPNGTKVRDNVKINKRVKRVETK